MNNIFEKSLEYVKENFANILIFILSLIFILTPLNFLSLNGDPSLLATLLNIISSIIVISFVGEFYLAVKEERKLRYFGGIYVLKDYGFEFVKLFLLVQIKTFLWALLFVIPGIIKGIEYQRTFFLKLKNPNLSNSECFEIAKEQMKGFKLQYFGLTLLVYILLILGIFVLSSIFYFTLSTTFLFLAIILGYLILFIALMLVFSIQANFNAEMDKYYEN